MEAATATQLESTNPATGARVGSVRTTRPEDVAGVAAAVAEVQPVWESLPLRERGRYLRRAAQVILDDTSAIRDLIVREQGKPRSESFLMEVLPSIDALHWMANEGPAVLADERVAVPQPFFRFKQPAHTFEPLGVIGVIGPANYPWTIPFAQVAMALMAGNGAVVKPSSSAPLTGEKIVEVFLRAGVPEGLVRAVHGPGTGLALAEAPAIAKVFCTGSTETGRAVSQACARHLKSAVLALAGKDPMIVLPDANLDRAIAGAAWGAFANAGQSGAGIERIYVLREVADRFVAGLASAARRLRLGDPLAWETEVGPLASAAGRDRVDALVREAVAAGARLECGGPVDAPAGLTGSWYSPTVLTGVDERARIMREEVSGPVVTVSVVSSVEEAIACANRSDYSLGASIWTSDRPRGELMAKEIRAGMVWLNDHLFSHGAAQCAWGGVGTSGLGRVHSRFGFYECVNVKLRVWDPGRLRNPWWHPYDETLARAMRAASEAIYGRERDRLPALREGLRPLLSVGRRMLRGG